MIRFPNANPEIRQPLAIKSTAFSFILGWLLVREAVVPAFFL
jgi:hypothetical protein